MQPIRTGLMLSCSALVAVACGAGTPADKDVTKASETSASAGVVLVDLGDPAQVATWTTVNDPVMGGKSTSAIAFAKGGLVFSGTISLENNGGFASTRGPQDPDIGHEAIGATSLRVRALGDGKTYLVKVGISGQPWSYVQRFTTEAAVQKTYDLPIDGFQPVGMRLDPDPNAPRTLDPSGIDQVSLYILDKQQGPFELDVSAIEATG